MHLDLLHELLQANAFVIDIIYHRSKNRINSQVLNLKKSG